MPGLGTVLANEEVIDGKSEVGGFPVERRPMRQWMLRITAYADRLLNDLDALEWPEPLKEMQRNWIGTQRGAHVDFEIVPPDEHVRETDANRGEPIGEEGDDDLSVTVFTTRPDTLYGATYMVLAPEHPLVDRITPSAHRETIEAYRTQCAARSERDRMAESKEKTGVFTGANAINPVNGEKIPIYIADYVLMGYGTGAIMAVPAHDERDFEFAQKFKLPIRAVVMPDEAWLKAESPSPHFDTLALSTAYLEDAGIFKRAFTGERCGHQFPGHRRLEHGGCQEPHHRSVGGRRHGSSRDNVQAARLAFQPAALLGRAVPGGAGCAGQCHCAG